MRIKSYQRTATSQQMEIGSVNTVLMSLCYAI